MNNAETLSTIRKELELHVGERVKLKANGGRKKSLVKEGVIYETYPSLFTVRVNIDNRSIQTLSYTYSDILTSNVELTVVKNNKRI